MAKCGHDFSNCPQYAKQTAPKLRQFIDILRLIQVIVPKFRRFLCMSTIKYSEFTICSAMSTT